MQHVKCCQLLTIDHKNISLLTTIRLDAEDVRFWLCKGHWLYRLHHTHNEQHTSMSRQFYLSYKLITRCINMLWGRTTEVKPANTTSIMLISPGLVWPIPNQYRNILKNQNWYLTRPGILNGRLVESASHGRIWVLAWKWQQTVWSNLGKKMSHCWGASYIYTISIQKLTSLYWYTWCLA